MPRIMADQRSRKRTINCVDKRTTRGLTRQHLYRGHPGQEDPTEWRLDAFLERLDECPIQFLHWRDPPVIARLLPKPAILSASPSIVQGYAETHCRARRRSSSESYVSGTNVRMSTNMTAAQMMMV